MLERSDSSEPTENKSELFRFPKPSPVHKRQVLTWSKSPTRRIRPCARSWITAKRSMRQSNETRHRARSQRTVQVKEMKYRPKIGVVTSTPRLARSSSSGRRQPCQNHDHVPGREMQHPDSVARFSIRWPKKPTTSQRSRCTRSSTAATWSWCLSPIVRSRPQPPRQPKNSPRKKQPQRPPSLLQPKPRPRKHPQQPKKRPRAVSRFGGSRDLLAPQSTPDIREILTGTTRSR